MKAISKATKPTRGARASFLFSAPTRWSSSKETAPNNDTGERVEAMRRRFRTDESQAHTETWSSLWKEGITPWDLSKPTPALKSELEVYWERLVVPSIQKHKTTRLRSLVAGCGAGYDLVTLAQHHDNMIASGVVKSATVVGLDLAPVSLERAAEQLESAFEFSSHERLTKVELVQGDFFASEGEWEPLHVFGGTGSSNLEENSPGHFDFIFDYTFFCAIDPSMRLQWGHRMGDLLVPGSGYLLTLMFPTVDAGEMQGPPYPVSLDAYEEVLLQHMVDLVVGPHENLETVPPRRGMELASWWKSMVIHQNQKFQ